MLSPRQAYYYYSAFLYFCTTEEEKNEIDYMTRSCIFTIYFKELCIFSQEKFWPKRFARVHLLLKI